MLVALKLMIGLRADAYKEDVGISSQVLICRM
jgi:hypothetical protein